jgi:ABC-type lipoprotein export system ATPase subunit
MQNQIININYNNEAISVKRDASLEQLLKNIKSLTGKTCLIVTHRPAALAIADKVFALADGKLQHKNKNELA